MGTDAVSHDLFSQDKPCFSRKPALFESHKYTEFIDCHKYLFFLDI